MKIQFSVPNANLATAYLMIDNVRFTLTTIADACRTISMVQGAANTRINVDIPVKIQETGHSGTTSVSFITIDDTEVPELINWKSVTVQQFQGGEITFIPYDQVPVNTVIPPESGIPVSIPGAVAAGLVFGKTNWAYRADRTHSLVGTTSFSGVTCQVDPNAVNVNAAARAQRKAQGVQAFQQSLGIAN